MYVLNNKKKVFWFEYTFSDALLVVQDMNCKHYPISQFHKLDSDKQK